MRRGQEDGKSLSENAVWRYLLQLLLGLQHIHDKKIVHRDIKTLNIFIAQNDFIKIGDLGVARFMSTNTAMAETGAFYPETSGRSRTLIHLHCVHDRKTAEKRL